MIQGAFRAQEVNPAKLAQLYRREFQLCQARKGETIDVGSIVEGESYVPVVVKSLAFEF